MLSPQRLTMLIFFLQPIAFGSWLPRIPEVQQGLGLGPQGLAIALLGLPVGTLLTLPFPLSTRSPFFTACDEKASMPIDTSVATRLVTRYSNSTRVSIGSK